LFSDFPVFSLLENGSIFYFRYFFFSLGVCYLIDIKSNLINKFCQIIFLCLIILSFDAYFQFLFGFNILGILPPENKRISSFFGNEAILGRYFSYFVIILLIIFLKDKLTRKEKIVFLFVFPLLIATIFISGDRVPLLRTLIFIVALVLVLKNNFKIYLSSLVITLCISIFLVFSLPSIKSRLIDNSFELIKSNQLFYAPYGRDYEDIYITSFNIGMLNPIFGNGPNTFSLYCSKPESNALTHNCSHPHNFYLQLFSEQGFIGSSFLVFTYLYLLFSFIKNLHHRFFKNQNENKDLFQKNGILLSILIILIPIIPNMDFYNNWNNIFIFILIGMYLNSINIGKEKLIND